MGSTESRPTTDVHKEWTHRMKLMAVRGSGQDQTKGFQGQTKV
jgi:hypothetical protein